MSGAVSFHVFSKGGFVLYSSGKVEGSSNSNVLSRLVCEHLLEERASPEFVCGSHVLRWHTDNQTELVFVVSLSPMKERKERKKKKNWT